jgi:hypothetical protein
VIVGSSDALPLAERAALARGIISIFVFFNYEVSQNKGFLRDSGAVNECGGVKTGKAHRRQCHVADVAYCHVADVAYCRAARSCFLSRRSLSRRSLSLVARHRQGAFLKSESKPHGTATVSSRSHTSISSINTLEPHQESESMAAVRSFRAC